jgi:hypothetical protein
VFRPAERQAGPIAHPKQLAACVALEQHNGYATPPRLADPESESLSRISPMAGGIVARMTVSRLRFNGGTYLVL